jgi:hypothetical protein
MLVRVIAAVSSGDMVLQNVDVTPLATFVSSTPKLAVSRHGVVTVAQYPSDASSNTTFTGVLSVAESVKGTAMQISPLSVDILSSEVSVSKL